MESVTTDEILISHIQKGEHSFFDDLVDRYSQKLLNYVYQLTNNSEDSEDLLQEVFIRVFSNIKKFDINKQFKPWVYKIATNICYDYSRKKKKVISLHKNYASEEGSELLETIADDAANPEENILNEELLAVLKNAISSLPKKQKEAFVMFHFDNFSYNEIADSLDIPVGTVKSRLFNAYERVYFDVKKENSDWALKILIALIMGC